MDLNVGSTLLILIVWIFMVLMEYKTSRDYMGIPTLLGIGQMALIVYSISVGYFTEAVPFMVVASLCFLILGGYKDAIAYFG